MNAPQRSEAWLLARCGRATASCFSDVLAKGKEGLTRKKYLRRVVAERLTGKPIETFRNGHTDRGELQEPLALVEYEIQTGNLVEASEFIPHPTLMTGCSPDGLIGDDGGGEFKSVIPTVQIETYLRGDMPPEHKPQVQGNLWLTGRAWWDFASFCEDMRQPHLRLVVYRQLPDAEYIANLEREVRAFLKEADALYEQLSGSTLLDQLVASVEANSAASQA